MMIVSSDPDCPDYTTHTDTELPFDKLEDREHTPVKPSKEAPIESVDNGSGGGNGDSSDGAGPSNGVGSGNTTSGGNHYDVGTLLHNLADH